MIYTVIYNLILSFTFSPALLNYTNHPGNLTSQTLTQASAPVLTSLPSLPPSNHRTALTPPGPAFLTAVLFVGFATLQMYTCVSKEPEAQYCESDVQESELILALWLIQRDVTIFKMGNV